MRSQVQRFCFLSQIVFVMTKMKLSNSVWDILVILKGSQTFFFFWTWLRNIERFKLEEFCTVWDMMQTVVFKAQEFNLITLQPLLSELLQSITASRYLHTHKRSLSGNVNSPCPAFVRNCSHITTCLQLPASSWANISSSLVSSASVWMASLSFLAAMVSSLSFHLQSVGFSGLLWGSVCVTKTYLFHVVNMHYFLVYYIGSPLCHLSLSVHRPAFSSSFLSFAV